MELTHEDIRELLPAFAMGAVPEDEATLIRAHILDCEECMQEADAFAETSARLALAAPTESLPSGFADRVMAAATGDRDVVPAGSPSRRGFLIPALAALGVLLIAAVFTFQMIDRQNDRSRLDRARIALASQAGIVLDGTEGVEAKVVPNGVGSVFAASGMEEAPDGKTYQLWLIDEGKPVSAGTFEVQDGVGFLEVAQPVEDYDSAAVTIERAGGADAPTTDPVLSS